jgi:hypothetical protein
MVHQDQRSENSRRRRVEAGHTDGRRWNQRLLSATGASALALSSHRQISINEIPGRVCCPNHDEVQRKACERDDGHDALMLEREPD